ncbi:sugar phosphate isomerase/epimerase [Schumannella luteola]|uniref:Sugar phosphate isomerase/epimerase n=1 Tax=Schumannella luteola TaxID=472059 RepID=A0A852Y6C7_9MICO|nr:sugar phosphate isomerase/epimerase [Schumannella luteola]NYG98506.1 sugar phosphate isomerase/epimerase [Schumannella luteola]TPX01270.1 sugar phosphate isomerase/epimerase [Schumannella luteola]
MRVGLYLAALLDLPLAEALARAKAWGITDAEVPSAGFNIRRHCDPAVLSTSAAARDEFQQVFADAGVNLAILNANGNPTHPDPEVSVPHKQDLLDSIVLSSQLGLPVLNAMSGNVGSNPAATLPTWSLVPWESGLLEVRDYQWSVAIPAWKEIADFAEDHGVKLALEIHPHMLTYNPGTLERFIDAVGSDSLGVNLDPSHLFWQGIDPSRFAKRFAGRVWHVAAKDTVLDAEGIAEYGVLDDRFTSIPAEEEPQPLGGRYLTTRPPENGPWHFVAVGRGHDTAWWTQFLADVRDSGFDGAVCIENEDWDLPREESIPIAVATLQEAIGIRPAAAA